MEFGMSPGVGPINIADNGPRFLSPSFRRAEGVSDETEVAIDREVKSPDPRSRACSDDPYGPSPRPGRVGGTAVGEGEPL